MNPSWQKKVEEIILGIKTSADRQVVLRAWKKLSNEFLKAKIDTILLACTDLNVILKDADPSFQIVDSSLCLAEATVKKWQALLCRFTSIFIEKMTLDSRAGTIHDIYHDKEEKRRRKRIRKLLRIKAGATWT